MQSAENDEVERAGRERVLEARHPQVRGRQPLARHREHVVADVDPDDAAPG